MFAKAFRSCQSWIVSSNKKGSQKVLLPTLMTIIYMNCKEVAMNITVECVSMLVCSRQPKKRMVFWGQLLNFPRFRDNILHKENSKAIIEKRRPLLVIINIRQMALRIQTFHVETVQQTTYTLHKIFRVYVHKHSKKWALKKWYVCVHDIQV